VHTDDIIFTAATAGVNFTGSTTAVNYANPYRGSIKIDGNDIWEDEIDDDTYGTINVNMRSYGGQQGYKRSLNIGNGLEVPIAVFSGKNANYYGEVKLFANQISMDNLPTSSGATTAIGYLYKDASGYVRIRLS
jgi:hypothetical protein